MFVRDCTGRCRRRRPRSARPRRRTAPSVTSRIGLHPARVEQRVHLRVAVALEVELPVAVVLPVVEVVRVEVADPASTGTRRTRRRPGGRARCRNPRRRSPPGCPAAPAGWRSTWASATVSGKSEVTRSSIVSPSTPASSSRARALSARSAGRYGAYSWYQKLDGGIAVWLGVAAPNGPSRLGHGLTVDGHRDRPPHPDVPEGRPRSWFRASGSGSPPLGTLCTTTDPSSLQFRRPRKEAPRRPSRPRRSARPGQRFDRRIWDLVTNRIPSRCGSPCVGPPIVRVALQQDCSWPGDR
ncbi:MAG: hypothetical protein KatS3mg011_2102 [Acidimicrobiia bacterium]|nr:MAG: hypothetical protein KatS3mg011_2102 [Acidimicrobiia bacterium]